MIYEPNNLKNFPKSTGIYKIYFKNSKSSNVYIGSASGKNGFYNRWKSHISTLRNNNGLKILQSAFNKYTISNMIFEIVEECDPDICLEREQYYIDKFNSYKRGYNARPLSSNNGGIKMSDLSKEKIYNKWKLARDFKSNEIKELYERGKTTREISKLTGTSRNFIRKIFIENDIIPRNERGCKKRRIYQYTRDGIFIKEYNSINACAKDLDINTHGIDLVLKFKCKHYKNYYFSFEKLQENEIKDRIEYFIKNSKITKYLNIKQFDINGYEIKIWKDIKEIINFYNFNNVQGVANSIRKGVTYKGFYWKI